MISPAAGRRPTAGSRQLAAGHWNRLEGARTGQVLACLAAGPEIWAASLDSDPASGSGARSCERLLMHQELPIGTGRGG